MCINNGYYNKDYGLLGQIFVCVCVLVIIILMVFVLELGRYIEAKNTEGVQKV